PLALGRRRILAGCHENVRSGEDPTGCNEPDPKVKRSPPEGSGTRVRTTRPNATSSSSSVQRVPTSPMICSAPSLRRRGVSETLRRCVAELDSSPLAPADTTQARTPALAEPVLEKV